MVDRCPPDNTNLTRFYLFSSKSTLADVYTCILVFIVRLYNNLVLRSDLEEDESFSKEGVHIVVKYPKRRSSALRLVGI